MLLAWLGQEHCCKPEKVGRKAAGLSRLMTEYPVPRGFCLTASAHRAWKHWSNCGVGQARRDLLPPEMSELLNSEYERLSNCDESTPGKPAVAVRSSGINEDGAKLSFAGQYDTYLNVAEPSAVAEAIVRCWQSATADRVLAYGRANQIPVYNLDLAVLVQRFIAADVSAVAFSRGPIGFDRLRDRVIVNASWGLGDSTLGGKVNPDVFVVDKAGLTVEERKINDKRSMTVPFKKAGTRQVKVPRLFRCKPALSDRQAIEIARMAISLEQKSL